MGASLKACRFNIMYSPADDPLVNFYIPGLAASVRYDRSAGFFSSSALAVAARGVAGLIQNDGQMRLLVGAQLSQEDVDAIQQGHDLSAVVQTRMLASFSDPQNLMEQNCLEALAWLVSSDHLHIKVVLPKDARGLPIPAPQSMDYYHPKTGILTDAEGNQVAFSGSVNESATAWQNNYEMFSVYFSWNETLPYLKQIQVNFDKLWQGRDADWIAMEVSEAVTQRLIRYRPKERPAPQKIEILPVQGEPISQKEKIIFQYLRDAPFLITMPNLGVTTCAIQPWPHQIKVANSVLKNFPEKAILCDEVGLGKTIEAGLIMRQLILNVTVKRCLILSPKSVQKQWQEELYEKFVLDFPRYDAGKFYGVYETPLDNPEGNPWDAYDLLLVGSQLAKRSDRRDEILGAKAWDLVVVDEAHHARRKDFLQPIYRPNRLLSLLHEMLEAGKIGHLILMTATPMQVHPVEVWDLLSLAGMGGAWAASENYFLGFFSEMRKPFNQVNWELVFDLVHDYLETGGEIDPNFREHARQELGAVKADQLFSLPEQSRRRNKIINDLGPDAHRFIREMAQTHTPIQHFIYRNTREILREYQRQGLLHDSVPTRNPQIIRVPMTDEEYAVYQQIEEYISNFYAKYENERKGLGFVMTVYRRRLTSSFYAIRCSLERRLAFLKGEINLERSFDDDDLEQEDLAADVSEEEITREDQRRFKEEIEYVKHFIHKLRFMADADSKIKQLKDIVNQIFHTHQKMLVFSQYTDTMDYVRSQMVQVYGKRVACYSGRGGEIWDGLQWQLTTKEYVKNEFKNGDVDLLICTDSASEGLNLQACGVLINYDMPWNPMRVEQRIGRIDRIGQVYDEVFIHNFFYMDTIEDVIYQRLKDRIHWFEVVIGELQPILGEVNQLTQRLAMMPAAQREQKLTEEIRGLSERVKKLEKEKLYFDEKAKDLLSKKEKVNSPLDLKALEQFLTQKSCLGSLFKPHTEITDAYWLSWQSQSIPVTFSAECFDQHPSTVRLLSYGQPLIEDLLEKIEAPNPAHSGNVMRLWSQNDHNLSGWYYVDRRSRKIIEVDHMNKLLNYLESDDPISIEDTHAKEAIADFRKKYLRQMKQREGIISKQKNAIYLAEHKKGQLLLMKAGCVLWMLNQQPELLEINHITISVMDHSISDLQRLGYPWTALLRLAYEENLTIRTEVDYLNSLKNKSKDQLQDILQKHKRQAEISVERIQKAKQEKERAGDDEITIHSSVFSIIDRV